MRRYLARNYDSLAAMYEFAEEALAQNDIDEAVRFPVHLAMEELFTNMVKYSPDADSDISVEIEIEDGRVRVAFTEFDVDEFDVSRPRDVDTEASLDERTPGGLGIFLVLKMVDAIRYDYSDRTSRITFTKSVA